MRFGDELIRERLDVAAYATPIQPGVCLVCSRLMVAPARSYTAITPDDTAHTPGPLLPTPRIRA